MAPMLTYDLKKRGCVLRTKTAPKKSLFNPLKIVIGEQGQLEYSLGTFIIPLRFPPLRCIPLRHSLEILQSLETLIFP